MTNYLNPPYSEFLQASFSGYDRKSYEGGNHASPPGIAMVQRKRVENSPQRYPEPTVGGFIVNSKGEVLLCRSEKWLENYTIPGGHIELGERMEEALKREVKEEVGLDVDPVRLLLMQEAIYSEEFYKRRHFIFLDYLCRTRSSRVRIDNTEIQSYRWVKPKTALRLPVDTFTRRLLKKYLALENAA